MLVSLPAGLHGHPINDGKSIDALIHKHRATLEFTPVTGFAAGIPATSAQMAYWIGDYQPEHYHAIELIGPDNLQDFEYRLQQNSLYQTETLSDARPCLIIITDGLTCEPASLARLQAMSLAVVQTPLSSKTVIRNLAYAAAEDESNLHYHGVVLSVFGEGILLGGESGLGKSGVALELIARGHRLVADDSPLLHRPGGADRLFAVSSPLLADLLEVRAAGILNISKLFGEAATQAIVPIDLYIELVRDFQPDAGERLQPFHTRTKILDVDIPHLRIPVSHSANPALLVETLSRNHVLYKNGFDASAQLIHQQRQIINKQTL